MKDAPHQMQDMHHTLTSGEKVVSFAEPGDYYQVMYSIGGGGAHYLTVKDFQMVIKGYPKEVVKVDGYS